MPDKFFAAVEISWGTMVDIHVVSAIELFAKAEGLADVVHLCNEFWAETDQETRSYILYEEIFDAMNGYAEDGFYFGAHPNDGSAIGFWMWDDYDA